MLVVRHTKDYNQFILLEENRTVNEKDVTALMKSIKEYNLLKYKPIIVTDKMEVIDGQNRLEAAKRLNVPISFIIANNIQKKKALKLLNLAQKNWNSKQWLNYYTHGELAPDYIRFNDFIERHQLSITQGLQFFKKSNDKFNTFSKGSFSFSEEDQDLDETVKYIKDFWDIIESHRIRPNRAFRTLFCIRAIVRLLECRNIDRTKLMTKLEENWPMIGQLRSVDEYKGMFLEIYNIRCKNRITKKDLVRAI